MAKKLSKSTIDLLVKKLQKKLDDLYTTDTPEIRELIKEHKIQCGEKVKEVINSVPPESILDLMYASRNLYHAKMIYPEDFVKKAEELEEWTKKFNQSHRIVIEELYSDAINELREKIHKVTNYNILYELNDIDDEFAEELKSLLL